MASESILVVKKRGRKTEIKVTKKMRSGYSPDSFTQKVNLYNFKDLALFLHDLEDLWGAPVDKAVKQYLFEKEDGWPF